ncbi:MAG TPA: AmmeMemoRadiSam system protein A [Vicinamibacterales bacterium]|nr:AmmeMemoRadiSam system protein A [Vicinamibacterales bacterium]HPW20523.1 AmmeMemoRadiSam system protein A [Vicinamibacterales bacterium]
MAARLTDEDRRRLLAIARRAVADALAGRPRAAVDTTGALGARASAFVSFHSGGALRGCIGRLGATQPLAAVVADCAVAAATDDPRFDPVGAGELDGCVIEISVLGPVSPVDDPEDIVVGRHGLIVEQGWQRGLLLPQVAVEQRWDRDTFLERTCGKAGLAPDAWRRGARVSLFEADIFDDAAPGAR